MKIFKSKAFVCFMLVLAMASLMIPVHALSMTYTPSSAYASSTYYSKLRAVQLTGNQRQDLVNVALTQMGYHEGNSTSDLGGGNQNGEYNYTEYGYWYGKQILGSNGHYGAWCAMFVAWCARQAGIPSSIISNACYAGIKDNAYYFRNLTYYTRGNYTPRGGDLVFFDWPNQSGEWNHVAIAYLVSNGVVYTIEGNTVHNKAEIRAFSLTDPIVKGYGVPKYTSSGSVTPTVSVSGIPVYDFYNPINHIPPKTTISSGTQGKGTSWLQAALRYIGYSVQITDNFDSTTVTALKAFQRDHGMTVNGICTMTVVNRLQSILDSMGSSPTPTPTPTPNPNPTPTRTIPPILQTTPNPRARSRRAVRATT